MKLDELPLPKGWHSDSWGMIYGTEHMRAAMRAGALAALDEAIKKCEAAQMSMNLYDSEVAEGHRTGARSCETGIRRLRDTIMEGK